MALLLAPLGAAESEGSSAIREDASAFGSGVFNCTAVDAGALGLDYEYGTNDSWPNNWTLMNRGRPGNLTLPIAYDSANNVLVMHQGGPFNPLNYTWIYDFEAGEWTMRSTSTAPPYAGVMAYDSRNGVVILQYSNPPYLVPGETWAYNVSLNAWTNLSPPGGPVNLSNSAMVYDSVNKVMVLFGGGWTSSTNDTWTYDFSANAWTNKYPLNPPPARSLHSMAFDESCGEAILFGGHRNTNCNDTWAYNVANNTWTQRFPRISPPALVRASSVYDSSNNETILFGGATDTGYSQDTWTYSSSANLWTLKHPDNAPSSRCLSGMAFNSRENVAVLFGGWEYGYAGLGDLWTYDASRDAWTDMTDYQVPSPRGPATMAFNDKSGKSMLFSGGYGWGSLQCDTYSYDLATNSWERLYPSGSPPARCGIPMVYDSWNDELIVFGGYYYGTNNPMGDTWTYNFTFNTWIDRNPDPHPDDRFLQAMAFDSTTGKTLLFGGFGNLDKSDTWSYDVRTNTWTNLNPSYHPNQRYGAGMAYDKKNKVSILFGGFDADYHCIHSDTWKYNATSNTWINVTPARSPPGRLYHTMAYDDEKGLIYMFGGSTDGDTCNDTWSYNTATNKWTKIQTVRAPMARSYQAMTFDRANRAIVLFGGIAKYDTVCGDVWAFDLKHLADCGSFTSAELATGGEASFGALEWEGFAPARTALRFQLRSADSQKNLSSRPFIGPDGTPGTFYAQSGQPIASIHNGSGWVQYRAYFNSADISATPWLWSVTINFNLPPALAISSPQGGESWTGWQAVRWRAADSDNDALTFDILLENASGSQPLVEGLPNGTDQWAWDTSAVADGTYRLRIRARTADASIPLSSEVLSAEFTIFHPPPPNRPPHVELLAPRDGSGLDSTSVRLRWWGSDPDGDSLTYTVSYSVLPLFSGQVRTVVTTSGYADLAGLEDKTTYYWSVDANDTKTNLTDIATAIWRFEVKLPPPKPPPNRPPRLTSMPPLLGKTGQRFRYNLTAADEDGDPLLFTLVAGPPNMTLNGYTGALRWTPGATEAGNFTVSVEVSDGRGGTDRQTFVIEVLGAPAISPPEKPLCRISSPADGSKVRGTVEVRGTAAAGTFPLSIVWLRVDGGGWTAVSGLENWSLAVDTAGLSNGRHRLEAWAFDGQGYSDRTSIEITVDNQEPFGAGTVYVQIAIPTAFVAIVMIVAVLLSRRRPKAGT